MDEPWFLGRVIQQASLHYGSGIWTVHDLNLFPEPSKRGHLFGRLTARKSVFTQAGAY